MAIGYIRNDTTNNIANGNIINAADLDGEFDAIQAAYDVTTGHDHDGTVGGGAPIKALGPAQDVVITTSVVRPKTDNTVDLGTSTLEFKDLYLDGTAKVDTLTVDENASVTGTLNVTGTTTLGTVNVTTIDTTNLEVTNLKAKDGTAAGSIANTTGVVTLASSVLTTTDINGGTVDGVTIATSDITVGTGKTLNVSAGTLTLADNQISGDKVEGGTINAITITTLGSTTGNITTVNSTTVDTTNIEVTNLKAKDGTSAGSIANLTGVVTLASSVLTTTDINGGTVDGAVIGGASAAAGTFTTATATTGNITTVNATTVDTTNIEVTNIKAKDGTASATIADTTGVMTVASLVATTADINGGTVDNATIATSDITVGAGKTLNVSAGTLTLADNQISGDKVEGGTINAITVNTLGSTTGNITTVNATAVDTTNIEVTNLKAKDGTSAGSIADTTGVVTLDSSVLTTTDINGGTVDGAVIGGSSAAAITGTTITATGDLTIPDKIVHAGDTNTAIRFPAADTVTVETSGVERLRIDSSGRLLIGTTTSTSVGAVGSLLQVRAAGVTAGASFTRTSNDANSPLVFLGKERSGAIVNSSDTLGILGFSGYDGAAYQTAAWVVASVDGTPGLNDMPGRLVFSTSAAGSVSPTERMRITSAGNVGIGTTTPARPLDVNGTARLADGAALEWGGITAKISGSSSTNTLIFSTNNAERMRITSAGNVGIGTNSPAQLLDVRGNSGANIGAQIKNDGAGRAVLELDAGGASETLLNFKNQGTGTARFMSGTTNYLAFGVGSSYTEAMRITSAGNVGIGTSSPAARLDVTGASVNALQARFGNIAGRGLEISTASFSGQNEAASVFNAKSTGALGTLIFQTDSTERMRISNAGNVGIGNTAPITPLHVTGATVTTGVVFKNQPAQTVESAAATLTIAELLTGIIQYTGTLATLTMPIGTDIEGGVPATFPTNMSFDFSVINTGAGVVTLGTATGLTLVGSMDVGLAASGLFRVRKTALNTYTIYRIS